MSTLEPSAAPSNGFGGPISAGLHQCLVLQHEVMAATNKIRQPSDYFVEGPGSSAELQLE